MVEWFILSFPGSGYNLEKENQKGEGGTPRLMTYSFPNNLNSVRTGPSFA